MDEYELIKTSISESIAVKQKMMEGQVNIVLEIANKILDIIQNKGVVYLFGNGGSAADAQHVAAELVGRFKVERKPLPAEAFTRNTSILTAIGNDYGFSQIFVRQVRARVQKNDLVVGISTSGRSKNVIEALSESKKIGAHTIGFTGKNPNDLKSVSDICLCVPSTETPRIQEAHILTWHIICDLVERKISMN